MTVMWLAAGWRSSGHAAAGVRFNCHYSRTGQCMQPTMMISMTLGGGFARAAT